MVLFGIVKAVSKIIRAPRQSTITTPQRFKGNTQVRNSVEEIGEKRDKRGKPTKIIRIKAPKKTTVQDTAFVQPQLSIFKPAQVGVQSTAFIGGDLTRIGKTKSRTVYSPLIQETGEGITFRRRRPINPKQGLGQIKFGVHQVPIRPDNAFLIRPNNPTNTLNLVKQLRGIQQSQVSRYSRGSTQLESIPIGDVRNLSIGGVPLKRLAKVSSAKDKELKKGDIIFRRVGSNPEDKYVYGGVGDTFYIKTNLPNSKFSVGSELGVQDTASRGINLTKLELGTLEKQAGRKLNLFEIDAIKSAKSRGVTNISINNDGQILGRLKGSELGVQDTASIGANLLRDSSGKILPKNKSLKSGRGIEEALFDYAKGKTTKAKVMTEFGFSERTFGRHYGFYREKNNLPKLKTGNKGFTSKQKENIDLALLEYSKGTSTSIDTAKKFGIPHGTFQKQWGLFKAEKGISNKSNKSFKQKPKKIGNIQENTLGSYGGGQYVSSKGFRLLETTPIFGEKLTPLPFSRKLSGNTILPSGRIRKQTQTNRNTLATGDSGAKGFKYIVDPNQLQNRIIKVKKTKENINQLSGYRELSGFRKLGQKPRSRSRAKELFISELDETPTLSPLLVRKGRFNVRKRSDQLIGELPTGEVNIFKPSITKQSSFPSIFKSAELGVQDTALRGGNIAKLNINPFSSRSENRVFRKVVDLTNEGKLPNEIATLSKTNRFGNQYGRSLSTENVNEIINTNKLFGENIKNIAGNSGYKNFSPRQQDKIKEFMVNNPDHDDINFIQKMVSTRSDDPFTRNFMSGLFKPSELGVQDTASRGTDLINFAKQPKEKLFSTQLYHGTTLENVEPLLKSQKPDFTKIGSGIGDDSTRAFFTADNVMDADRYVIPFRPQKTKGISDSGIALADPKEFGEVLSVKIKKNANVVYGYNLKVEDDLVLNRKGKPVRTRPSPLDERNQRIKTAKEQGFDVLIEGRSRNQEYLILNPKVIKSISRRTPSELGVQDTASRGTNLLGGKASFDLINLGEGTPLVRLDRTIIPKSVKSERLSELIPEGSPKGRAIFEQLTPQQKTKLFGQDELLSRGGKRIEPKKARQVKPFRVGGTETIVGYPDTTLLNKNTFGEFGFIEQGSISSGIMKNFEGVFASRLLEVPNKLIPLSEVKKGNVVVINAMNKKTLKPELLVRRKLDARETDEVKEGRLFDEVIKDNRIKSKKDKLLTGNAKGLSGFRNVFGNESEIFAGVVPKKDRFPLNLDKTSQGYLSIKERKVPMEIDVFEDAVDSKTGFGISVNFNPSLTKNRKTSGTKGAGLSDILSNIYKQKSNKKFRENKGIFDVTDLDGF